MYIYIYIYIFIHNYTCTHLFTFIMHIHRHREWGRGRNAEKERERKKEKACSVRGTDRWHNITQTQTVRKSVRACVCEKVSACKCDVVTSYGVATIRGLLGRNRLFYRSLLQKRPIIPRSLPVAATPYMGLLYVCIIWMFI